jgi:hypothetical protein
MVGKWQKGATAFQPGNPNPFACMFVIPVQWALINAAAGIKVF